MASGLITNPLRSPGSDTDVRLRLKPTAPSSGHVDGSWWPRSRDLAAELPSLLATVTARVGSTERVSYHLGDWGHDASPDTTMSEDAARVLAVRVLQALDHIPETVR